MLTVLFYGHSSNNTSPIYGFQLNINLDEYNNSLNFESITDRQMFPHVIQLCELSQITINNALKIHGIRISNFQYKMFCVQYNVL